MTCVPLDGAKSPCLSTTAGGPAVGEDYEKTEGWLSSQAIASGHLIRTVAPFRPQPSNPKRRDRRRRWVRRTSCGGLVFLVGAARDDLQRIIWQRPLQRFGL